VSLVASLRDVAERGSGHGVHILHRGREADALGFKDLYLDAGRVAAGLLARNVSPGERVGVVLPTSCDFARAFFGVLAAGAVAVPLPAPVPFGLSYPYLARTAKALRQSQARIVLTQKSLVPLLDRSLPAGSGPLQVVDVQELMERETVFLRRAAHHDALVQYTSGTSSDPRGVVLTHGNVAAGVNAIALGTRLTNADIGCNWLALFHDMGLVGSFLTPVLHDVDTFLQSPQEFVRDPAGWVRAISRLGATFTMAPDSGYRYVLQRGGRESTVDLDLSRWRIAVNGAEPIDPSLQRAFAQRFAGAGLRENVFLPAYGLAEATLAVTFPPLGRPTKTIRVCRAALNRGHCEVVTSEAQVHRELVSVGGPVAEMDVQVVDEEGNRLEDGLVGELKVRGASVMTGYDCNPEATQRVVRPGGWVSTGDLAVRCDGEFYLVGRRKETIIVFGANHYASDIENVIVGIPDLTLHGVLAHQIQGVKGTGLGLLIETNEREPAAHEEMSGLIRSVLLAELGITPEEITYVRRGRIPRTSSGKILRRGALTEYPHSPVACT
jgi:fatty-acyl-CoA synthase